MAEFVRVKDKQTKHEYTVRADRVIPEAHTVLDKPALGRDLLPKPVTYHRPMGTPPPGSKPRKAAARKTPKPAPEASPAPDKNGQSAGSEEGDN